MPERTLLQHLEATTMRSVGGESENPRLARLLALRIDGRPLAEHGAELGDHKERLKRVDEILGLGFALVGAAADRDVRDVASVPPRGRTSTADFRATLVDGSTVLIEIARLVDSEEKRYVNALQQIAIRAQRAVAAVVDFAKLIGGDNVLVRFYGDNPKPHDIRTAAEELADVIQTEVPQVRASTTLSLVDDARYPTLTRLGAHWARVSGPYPARVMMDPMGSMLRPDLDGSFDRIVMQKKQKVASYTDGEPVWLALYGESQLTYPLGVVQRLAERDDVDPRPFERIIAGCFTAGVVFEAGKAPRYSSLTRDG